MDKIRNGGTLAVISMAQMPSKNTCVSYHDVPEFRYGMPLWLYDLPEEERLKLDFSAEGNIWGITPSGKIANISILDKLRIKWLRFRLWLNK